MMMLLCRALFVLTPVVVFFSGKAMTPVLILLVFALITAVKNSLFPLKRDWLSGYPAASILLALLLLWGVLSSYWSLLPGHSLSVGMRVGANCVIGGIGLFYVQRLLSIPARLLTYSAYGFILCAALILLEQLPAGGIMHYGYTLVGADFDRFLQKNVNRGLCALVVLIWPLVLGLYQSKQLCLVWSTVLILAIAVMSLDSLSAQIGLAAGMIAFVAIYYWPRVAPKMLILCLPLYLISFPALFTIAEDAVFKNPVVSERLADSGGIRLRIWHALLQEVEQRPWQGWGISTTRAQPLTQASLQAMGLEGPPLHPHNPSLQLLLELGRIGLLLATAALAVALLHWERSLRGDKVLLASSGALIAAYFVAGLASFGIWQFWWLSVLWIALIYWRWVAKQ